MAFTSKSRVALLAMIDVAVHQRSGAVTAKSVAERQQISLSYLEQVIARIRRAGLLEASRGRGGGYALTRPAREITGFEVLSAVDEGQLAFGQADIPSDQPPASQPAERIRHNLWTGLDAIILAHLQSVTLQQLVDQQSASLLRQPERQKHSRPMVRDMQTEISKRRETAQYRKAKTTEPVFALAQAWARGNALAG